MNNDLSLPAAKDMILLTKFFLIIGLLEKSLAIYFVCRFPAEGQSLPKPPPASGVEAYDFVQEVTDPDKLDELLADPDDMRMQALVIRERILG